MYLNERIETMIYNAPEDAMGNKYWVPIVVKNKDYLVGYSEGIQCIESLLRDSMKSMNVNFNIMDFFLDSTRFNNILVDGRRETELSDAERRNIITDLIKDKLDRLNDPHVENDIQSEDVLSVECSCGLGFYSWKTVKDIPSENYLCPECGKVLIDYTNHYDHEFDYDEGGKLK